MITTVTGQKQMLPEAENFQMSILMTVQAHKIYRTVEFAAASITHEVQTRTKKKNMMNML